VQNKVEKHCSIYKLQPDLPAGRYCCHNSECENADLGRANISGVLVASSGTVAPETPAVAPETPALAPETPAVALEMRKILCKNRNGCINAVWFKIKRSKIVHSQFLKK
jgi:hypothetical protein